MMFIAPMRPTAVADVTAVNPCSIACGMRCVPTRPFEVYPQMKKLPARSQKSRFRMATLSGVRRASAARSSAETVAPSPNGRAPTSAGLSRMKRSTGTLIATAANISKAMPERQPSLVVSCIIVGTKIS